MFANLIAMDLSSVFPSAYYDDVDVVSDSPLVTSPQLYLAWCKKPSLVPSYGFYSLKLFSFITMKTKISFCLLVATMLCHNLLEL